MVSNGKPRCSHEEAIEPGFIPSPSSDMEYVFPICGANQEAARDLGQLL